MNRIYYGADIQKKYQSDVLQEKVPQEYKLNERTKRVEKHNNTIE